MQRSGTEAIRTKLQPSKPKREITNITNSQNTKITYGQPSEQLFPIRWSSSNRNRTKNNMNTRNVKRHRNSREPQQNHRLGTVSNELLGGYRYQKLRKKTVSPTTLCADRIPVCRNFCNKLFLNGILMEIGFIN